MTPTPAKINIVKDSLLKMSIQVGLNGLSFCILNCNTNEIVWYKKTEFKKEHNPVKILQVIEELYNNEKQLQQEIAEVIVLFSHELYSFVPKEFFLEEEASNYLKFNTKILRTDVVAHDELNKDQLVNVYIPYTNITNYFFDRYGEYEYKHSISVLVEAVMDLPEKNVVTAYLNNFSGYYDLVIIKDQQLLLSNTFSYETREDFIYYLLFTAEQLKLDPSEFDLNLLGVPESSPLYEIAFTYVKNINIFEPGFVLNSSEDYGENFERDAYVLLKALKCE